MTRSHLFTVAAVFSLIACTDNPGNFGGPISPSRPTPPAPAPAMIAGRISVIGLSEDPVVELTDLHGDVFRLLGNETVALASVDGGDVIAFGTWDPSSGFVVQEFQVVGMLGRPALDGVLVVSEEGFALRLTDGSIHLVPGLTEECANYIGARLWVVGWDEDTDVVFGLIGTL